MALRVLAVALTLAQGVRSRSKASKGECDDPLAAMMKTLECIENKDAACVGSAFAMDLRKLHNGKDTRVPKGISTSSYWTNMLSLVESTSFSVDFEQHYGPNKVEMRWVKQVQTASGSKFGKADTAPWSQSLTQHEHVLAEVDGSCRIVRWDQYGDNAEQVKFSKAIDQMATSLM